MVRGIRGASVRLALPDRAGGEEAVPFVARHDVHVDVRDALTDPRVGRHEGAVRAECLLHRDRRAAHDLEERADQRRWQIVKGRHVIDRDDQRVSEKERARIEERDDLRVSIDDVAWKLARRDPA